MALPGCPHLGGIEMSEEQVVTVPDVADMEDETFIKHLEFRHPEVKRAGMTFTAEPGSDERSMREPGAWRGLHQANHRMYPQRYNHEHQGDGW